MTPEPLKDSDKSCSRLLSFALAMMPSSNFQPLQLKGEVMDLEFTIDTDHRFVFTRVDALLLTHRLFIYF